MNLETIIDEVFNLPKAKQQDDIKLALLDEWDSMSHMLFITRIEEHFGIEFTGDEIADISTIGDVRKLIESKE